MSATRGRRLGGQRVFGPGMTRILADQLASNRRIVSGPKPAQIGGDLDGALIGRQKVNYQRQATSGQLGPLGQAEEVLQARRNPRRLTSDVMDRGAATARQDDLLGKLLGEESAEAALGATTRRCRTGKLVEDGADE